MSGGQIGTVIGGAIGAYFGAGNPAAIQLGMAIGGTIGGIIDPTKINGPHIGDGQAQSATDGMPIAWVMGTASVAGTIVQVSKRREVKVQDSGKGGPVVSHYENRQDFAILVCESCSLRDSTVNAIVMVQQDGKIVYDMRTGSKIIPDSLKWKQNVDFLFGDEAQLPNPTLEAITGVGNTPSYRGVCLAVFKDFNITAAGGRIPQFQFAISSTSTATTHDNVLNNLVLTTTGHVCEKDQFNVHGWVQKNVLSGPAIPDFLITNIPNWALTKTVVNADSTTNTVGDICITASTASVHLDDSGTFDSGWVSYDGTVSTEAQAWFTSHGHSIPTLSVLPTWPAAYRAVDTINSVTTEQLRFAGTADDLPNQVDFKFALTGGRDLYPISGGYYVDTADNSIWRPSWVSPYAGYSTLDASSLELADMVARICIRGGLTAQDFDVTDLAGISVAGYPIARQAVAADCLTPLLQAYFCYGSEYDGKIHFKRYGADAAITIDDADLFEATDANDGNVTSEMRGQGTEFPRKITANYLDPAQNYTSVNVSVERSAVDVKAIGEQVLSIPVVMPANQAMQAVQKALKVAYATLEGKQTYSVPFARSQTYLSLCAGDPIIFRGKRWVLDDVTLGSGYMKLSTRYDRQGAYTSNVQAIVGNAPSAPSSPYSGPTKLLAMNLPSLRPQDTYGLYLAANAVSSSQNWRGCTVQYSLDGQVTWVNGPTIIEGSRFGTLAADEPIGGEPLTVQVNDDLETVTDAQITAKANGFAIKHAGGDEIGQFKTATEDGTIADKYALTDVTRGLIGTTRVAAVNGEVFCMLDSVYFLPISLDFSGSTIYLRAVGFNEVAEDATVISIVYTATQVVPTVTNDLIDTSGNFIVDTSGNQMVVS